MRTRPFAPCEDAGDSGSVPPSESWGGAGRPFGNGPEQSQSRKAPIISTAKALKDEVFPPIKFIVKGYLVEGATILAGRPKIGKSWLALDWSVAVARGGFCFGDVHCKEGDVLYIALEDNKRRLKSRLAKILGLIREWPEKLEYATEWPRANEGGLDSIRAWIRSKETPRLVVVDVLETFRSRARGNDNYYASDYETTKALQAIASETSTAILIIHHVRKGAADNDPIDKISGTLGLSGGSDSLLILDRDSNGATLYGRGRDIEEMERTVRFNRETCRWDVLGEAADVRRSSERASILEVLKGGRGSSDTAQDCARSRNAASECSANAQKNGGGWRGPEGAP
jgi:AAA domain